MSRVEFARNYNASTAELLIILQFSLLPQTTLQLTVS